MTSAARTDPPAGEARHAAPILGLSVFLATELMFFGPLLFGYAYGRLHFPDAFAAASRHTDLALGSINTALLLTSSATMAAAAALRRAEAVKAARLLLWSTAALGAAFLVIKGIEYAHEWQEHLFPGASFAFSGAGQGGGARFFYFLYFCMTGLHAVHLGIGIAIVCVFAIGLQRGKAAFAGAGRIELGGLYWHFIDVIWIFLYPLLYLVGRSAATGGPG